MKYTKSGTAKKCCFMILVRTHTDEQQQFLHKNIPPNIIVIDSYELQSELILEELHTQGRTEKIIQL